MGDSTDITPELDQTDEDILTCEVSDDAVEAIELTLGWNSFSGNTCHTPAGCGWC